MKFKHLVASLFLSLAASAGLVAGLSSGSDAKVAKAEILASGVTYIDLSESIGSYKWVDAGAKFGVYYWAGDLNGFSSFAVQTSEENGVFVAEYSLTFVPTNMKAVRFDGAADYPNWDQKWNETLNYDFYGHGLIGYWGYTDNGGSWAGALAETSGLATNVVLENYKRNGSGKPEHYGNVSLSSADEFDILYNGAHYNSYELGEGVDSSEFEINGEKIKAISGGTYSFYFNTDSQVLHIANPARAAADEFAQSFLQKTNGYCSAEIDDSVLTELKEEYDALKLVEGAQSAFYNAGIIRGKDIVDYGTYSCEALSRYANMQEQKGYGDFLGLGANNPKNNPAIYSYLFANDTNNTAIIVITIAAVSALAFTLLLVFKKKRQK